jgi:hypothetical protein
MPAAANLSLYSSSKMRWKMSLKVWSYCLEIVSLAENQRSCFVVERVVEARAREGLDGGILVVDGLQNARALEVVDRFGELGAVRAPERQRRGAGAGHAVLGALVEVAVGVARDRDGLFPVRHIGVDAAREDGRAEHGAVQDRADGAVRALPHLLELVFLDSLGVRRDGRALDAHAQAADGLARLGCHPVVRRVAVGKTEVVVFRIQLDKGDDQLVLDPFPEDAGHFVAVHLHDGVHGNLVHFIPPFRFWQRSNS